MKITRMLALIVFVAHFVYCENAGATPQEELANINHYSELSTAGHVLSWVSTAVLFPVPFLWYRGSWRDDREAERILDSGIALIVIGGVMLHVGVPLMMAAQYKVRCAFSRGGKPIEDGDRIAVRLDRAVWATYVFSASLLSVSMAFSILFPIPLGSVFAILTVSLAEALWRRVNGYYERQAIEGDSKKVSVMPWVSTVSGGFMVGAGGTF